MSRSSLFPDGLANRNRLVGKNLIFSSTTLGGASFEAGTFGPPDPRHLSAQRSIQDFYAMETPVEGVVKAGTLNFLVGYVEPISSIEAMAFRPQAVDSNSSRAPLWGATLKKRAREHARQNHVQFESFCEFYANTGTFVDLDPDVRDRFGMPVARITVKAHEKSARGTRLLRVKARQILDAMNPIDAYVTTDHTETKFLQGGTCRFGDDPASSVLDRDCRAHDVPNLYVTDGSFLPTSGGVPFTMTIMANSFRVAQKIIEQLRRAGE
jgi:choline dehydrogenase-like flavoprotein